MTPSSPLHVDPDTWREIEAYASAAELARKRDRELAEASARAGKALNVLLIIAAAILVVALVAMMWVHTYSGQNAGAFVDLPFGHWCGFEIRGNPGLFCDVT